MGLYSKNISQKSSVVGVEQGSKYACTDDFTTWKKCDEVFIFNPFHFTALFLYSLKTLKTRGSLIFPGGKEKPVGKYWLNWWLPY